MEAIKNEEFHSLKFGRKSTNFIELKRFYVIIFLQFIKQDSLEQEDLSFSAAKFVHGDGCGDGSVERFGLFSLAIL